MQLVKQLVKIIRKNRSWHKYLGVFLLTFILISSTTGILLAWKKKVDWLQPTSHKSTIVKTVPWLSVDSLLQKAEKALIQQESTEKNNKIKRLDLRPKKGIAKAIFENNYWEVQIDGRSGEIYSIKKRRTDWIEQLHDGSIISNSFKLWSMNILGLGLILICISGLLLWVLPKVIKKLKGKR